MEISAEICKQARQARDPRFDGHFFVAVRTTGIYCRPVCPVKMPREENVSYFITAASATEAGYRPCLRCRPETAPGTPAWRGTSTTVNRGLRLISEGVLDEISVDELSDRLGVTSRHLSRLFRHHLGASPKAVAQTRRLQFAKKLIDETALSMTDVAMFSGYGSVRRFNDHVRGVYQVSPSHLRMKGRGAIGGKGLGLTLSYRRPYDFKAMLDFLRLRAIPGVEEVNDDSYTRSLFIQGKTGVLTVFNREDKNALECLIQMESPDSLLHIVEKVKQLFDLSADPAEIQQSLATDPILKPIVDLHPGQRLPGAWDGFEIAVRALVGQQISVVGATSIMGRIVSDYGRRLTLENRDRFLFPEAETLAMIKPASLPMPLTRAKAIGELARQVAEGNIRFDATMDVDEMMTRMLEIKGIGPWTAQYVAMRAMNQPDAFLYSDLVIKKVVCRLFGIESEKQLIEHSENWRPWRAYASMHLWRCASQLP